jgi:hypothetical protein
MLMSLVQFLLSAMHIFIKLRALAIQQYNVEIMEKSKLKMFNNMNDIESAVTSSNIEDGSNDEDGNDAIVDIERYEKELDTVRQSVEELRLSSRLSMTKQEEDPILLTVPKSLVSSVEYPDENFKILHNQLNALNSKPLEYIPLYKIKQRLQILTEAMNKGEVVDENEFDHLLKCMDVNVEYIQEQKEKERLWREQISAYAQECLIEQRQFIPPDIFLCTQTQLVNDKGIPIILAKRLMQKKCLWLIRMSESYIGKLQYAELQGKYSVAGNNLDIVETLAIYACVPVKFPNDGNGKKALWRKSLDDTVKKLMASKENNTLSASQLRNPAYKTHIGSFTSDELYNPDMKTDGDEEMFPKCKSRDAIRSTVSTNEETVSPIHKAISDSPYLMKSDLNEVSSTSVDNEKTSIKSLLEHLLRPSSDRSSTNKNNA